MISNNYTQSEKAYQRAKIAIPGGVNSPVRAFNGVGGTPLFIQAAKGAYLYDIDNRAYIDYVGSWGPMILGHAYPSVIDAVKIALDRGLSFGAPTEIESELAEKIAERMPTIEKVRMVNSGTEATMSAIRLARGYTSKNKIIKFIGCYHGHADTLLAQAGSGALTLNKPSSNGVPDDFIKHTLLAEYNHLATVQTLFEAYPGEIAAIIVEPVAGNMNCIPPNPGFLEGLRQLCDQYHSLLIFDEVMTGFRVASGGAQAYYHIKPDLTTLGKIIGGGMPVGAFGGKAEIMDYLAPEGTVYQAGTLSGNPIAMTAGLATLNALSDSQLYFNLNELTLTLMKGLTTLGKETGIALHTQGICGMFGIFFTENAKVTDLEEAKACDQSAFKHFFHGMLREGIYLAPSSFEAGFMSLAHTDADIDKTLTCARKVLQQGFRHD